VPGGTAPLAAYKIGGAGLFEWWIWAVAAIIAVVTAFATIRISRGKKRSV